MEVEQTKARTKGERLRDKRRRFVRPRDVLAPREPNGRIQRDKFAAVLTVLNARRRHFKNSGIPDDRLLDPRMETELGRLWIIRDAWEAKNDRAKGLSAPGISQAQHDAGRRYRETYHRYLRAIDAPSPHPKPATTERVDRPPLLGFLDSLAHGDAARQRYEDACARWILNWRTLCSYIDDVSTRLHYGRRDLRIAAHLVCITDAPLKEFSNVRKMKIALWAIADYFKIRY